jgi:hypothetical protein
MNQSKIILNFLCLPVIAMFFFYGCAKVKESETVDFELEYSSEVKLWLNNQTKNTSNSRIQKIRELEANLDFEAGWSEQNGNSLLLITPVKKVFKFKNNSQKITSNYLISVKNIKGEIMYSLILQSLFKDTPASLELEEGDISMLLSSKPIGRNLNVRFINIYDNYMYEKEFSENQLLFQKYIDSKPENGRGNSGTQSTETCTAWYLVTTWPDGHETEVYLYTTCVGTTVGGNNGGDDGDGCYNTQQASVCPGDGGGGGNGGEPGGFDNNVDEIIINLTDSCLLSVVTSITTTTIATQVSTMFNNTFVGANAPANISFAQNSNLVNPQTGLPVVALSTPNPATHTWAIQLNPNYCPSASTEFWASVIVHELTHSFMTLYYGSNPNFQTLTGQHQQMFLNTVNQMSSFLIQNFGLSASHANALALGGIDDYLLSVSGSNNQSYINQVNSFVSQNYGHTFASAEAIRIQFKNGTLGQPCP